MSNKDIELNIPKTLDFKLTKKQQSMLDVISNPEYTHKTNKEKAQLAGITEKGWYIAIKQPNFVQAVRMRGLAETVCMTLPVLKEFHRQALKGSYMHGKDTLTMAGLIAQQPLINIAINQNTAPSEQVDTQLMNKIIDIIPQAVDTVKDSTTTPSIT